MSTTRTRQVAIIGSGPSGLTLALALYAHNISCTIYETRQASFLLGGAIVLAPNALRLLDSMGVYTEIIDQGLKADQMHFKDGAGVITSTFYMGHERIYGYQCLRILRRKLMDTLLKKVEEKKIPIVIKKFTSLLEENEDGVVLQFEDGSVEKADLVVGADGIHSTVRDLITTNDASEPTYTGFVGLNTVVETKKVRIPDNWAMPCITISKPGGFIMAPHDDTGEGIFLATQAAVPGQDKEGWRAMKDNYQYLRGLLRQGMKFWPDVVQSALDNIEDSITLWPFYVVPKLKDWTTPTGRVVIVGDAAHAIPPTIGQGMNQGLEDGYVLALILAHTSAAIPLSEGVAFWQRYRQERVDRIVELCRIFTNSILPKHLQDQMEESDIWRQEHPDNVEKELEKLKWLYAPRLDQEVMDWVRMKELEAQTLAVSVEDNKSVLVETNEIVPGISI